MFENKEIKVILSKEADEEYQELKYLSCEAKSILLEKEN